jgi:hypothetical protein
MSNTVVCTTVLKNLRHSFFILENMVRTYKRKREKGYSKNQLNGAKEEVNKGIPIRRAASMFNVPFPTLLRYCKQGYSPTSGGRFRPVFDTGLEDLLQSYLLDMSRRFLGLSTVDARRFAYDLAIANKLEIPESWNHNKCCGKDWLSGFLNRHPGMSLRKPEVTSLARASGFNKVVVDKFYSLLREILLLHNFQAARIYNVDETGISTT